MSNWQIVIGLVYFVFGAMASVKTRRAETIIGKRSAMPFWMLIAWPFTCFGVAMAAIDDLANQVGRGGK